MWYCKEFTEAFLHSCWIKSFVYRIVDQLRPKDDSAQYTHNVTFLGRVKGTKTSEWLRLARYETYLPKNC